MNYSEMVVLIVNKCTAKCNICCFDSTIESNELINDEYISNYLYSLKDLKEIQWVHFSGGEPFLYYDRLKKILKFAMRIIKVLQLLLMDFGQLIPQMSLEF